MKNFTLSGILHGLVLVASQAAIIEFVPEKYKGLVQVVAAAIVSISAWYDTTHADRLAGRR